MDIAARFKMVRDSLGLSQREMAKKLDSSLGALQSYEAGKSVPGGNVLEALARLGINVNWILTGEGEIRIGDKPKQFKNNDDLKNTLLTILNAIESAETLNLCPVSSLTPKERTALIYSMLVYAEDLINTCELSKREIYSVVPLAFSIVKRYEEMQESAKSTDKGIWETNLGKLLDAVIYVFSEKGLAK